MATDIEIFIGTSQDFLLSFKVKNADKGEHVLERYIAHRCHNGAIICMDTKGRYLATGGGDDRIVVVDLKLNRDVHEIVRHEGSINSLLFTNKGNDLLSGSEDGRLVATTVGSWIPINIWKKPHTGKGVLKVCLHPSDKFALSLGKDGTLRGWDMFKGTQINTFNTKDLSEANITLDNVELSPDGTKFAMSGAKTVTIISLIGEGPYEELTLKSRVTSLCWLDDQNLLIGMENGSIEWLNIKKSEQVNIPSIHTRRIKGMHHLNGFVGTICSNGTISLWAAVIPSKKLTLICTAIDESIRPTCIKLVDTTENRYQDKTNVDAEKLTDVLPQNAKKSRPISTTGKVIVETDGNENSEMPTNESLKVTDDDTVTEITTPKKSSKRKKATVAPRDVSSTVTPTGIEAHAKVPKRKKTAVSPTDVESTLTPTSLTKRKMTTRKSTNVDVRKTIVVRSPNSDDDFEKPKSRRSQTNNTPTGKAKKEKQLKQESPDGSTVVDSEKTTNASKTPTSHETPMSPVSCPNTSPQLVQKRRKLDFVPLSAPRNTRKKTVNEDKRLNRSLY